MIIVIAHDKGGVGKTSLAVNLIPFIHPVAVIDQDAHRCLMVINELRDTNNRWPMKQCDTTEALIAQFAKSSAVDHIVVDCGGFDSDLNRVAVAAADIVLVPTNGTPTELVGLSQFDSKLKHISEQMGKQIIANVVINRVHSQRKQFNELTTFVDDAEHLKQLKSIIPSRKVFTDSMREGKGVVELSKQDDKATAEVAQLAHEIDALIGIYNN